MQQGIENMSGKSGTKINRRRFVYSITPLLLMVAAIITVNVLATPPSAAQPPAGNRTAVPTQMSINTARTTPTRPPILQATILPSPTPTITPLPGVPAEAAIVLFGPPDESILPQDGRITLYWTYSEPLLPGQELVLTLRQNDSILATSSLSAPNFGQAYQISLDLSDLTELETAVWQVALQWKTEKIPLVSSENRRLTFLLD